MIEVREVLETPAFPSVCSVLSGGEAGWVGIWTPAGEEHGGIRGQLPGSAGSSCKTRDAPHPSLRSQCSVQGTHVCGVKIHTEPVAYRGAQGSCCEEEFPAKGFSVLWSALGFFLRLKQRLSGW